MRNRLNHQDTKGTKNTERQGQWNFDKRRLTLIQLQTKDFLGALGVLVVKDFKEVL